MGFGKKRSSKVGIGAITTDRKKLFAEGGMMDDGKDVDPVSGNDVPVGSLAEEVRDDVDAKLSPGEFVIPADVVRFIGLERLMKMRDEAKQGLARMNDIGQMGNAEEAGEKADDSYEDDDEFESEIDNIMKEVDREEVGRQTEMAFNTGGFVNPSYYDLTKAPKNPALDIRYFNDEQGKTFYVPFVNGKPMKPMPNGAVPTGTPSKAAPVTTTPTDLEAVGGGGGGGFGGGGAGVAIGVGSGLSGGTRSTTGDGGSGAAGGGTGTVFASGTYTGSNISDFGRSDMIYNPGGSGAAGELTTQDLYGGITRGQAQLGNAAVTALASAMGVPGILTQGIRWALKEYGQNAVNEFMGRLNQDMAGAAGGLDTSTLEGRMGAASQIDQLPDRGSNLAAASSGAIGTGGRAADVGAYVYEQLKDSGLSGSEIAGAAQKAVDSVIRGQSISDAINNAVLSVKPDFKMPEYEPFGITEGTMYNGDQSFGVNLSDMDYGSMYNFSKDIGFDWSTMGDFGDSDSFAGGGSFGKNNFSEFSMG